MTMLYLKAPLTVLVFIVSMVVIISVVSVIDAPTLQFCPAFMQLPTFPASLPLAGGPTSLLQGQGLRRGASSSCLISFTFEV